MDIKGFLICGIIGLLFGAGLSRTENKEEVLKKITETCKAQKEGR